MLDVETLQAALGAIYDTSLGSAGWAPALGQLSRLFRCHFADMFQRSNDYRHWRGIQVGLEERDYQDEFLGYWVTKNVWGQRRPTRQAGDIVTTRDMIGLAEMRRSEMYRLYLRPRQLEEGLRLDVWADAHGVEDISLLRPWSAGPYGAEELRAARMLMPHLRRASAVRRRLSAATHLAEAGLSSLEHLQMGVLMLRGDGRVTFANHAAESMLAAEDAVSVGAEGLVAGDTASTRALQRLIDDAAGQGRTPRSGSVRLPCASGRPAVLAIAMPVRPGTHDPFDVARPMTMLCLIDREHRAPMAAQLMPLFGLTRSEADLASALMAGQSVREIAAATGRSVNTARTLLARLMAKTETSRQSELMRLLVQLPSRSTP